MGFSFKRLLLGGICLIFATTLQAGLDRATLQKLATINSLQLCDEDTKPIVVGAHSYQLNQQCSGILVTNLSMKESPSTQLSLGSGLWRPRVIGNLIYTVSRESKQLWLLKEGKLAQTIELEDIPYSVKLDRNSDIGVTYFTKPATVVKTSGYPASEGVSYKDTICGGTITRIYNNNPDKSYIIGLNDYRLIGVVEGRTFLEGMRNRERASDDVS